MTNADTHKTGRQYCSLLVRNAQAKGQGFTLDAKNLLTWTNTVTVVLQVCDKRKPISPQRFTVFIYRQCSVVKFIWGWEVLINTGPSSSSKALHSTSSEVSRQLLKCQNFLGYVWERGGRVVRVDDLIVEILGKITFGLKVKENCFCRLLLCFDLLWHVGPTEQKCSSKMTAFCSDFELPWLFSPLAFYLYCSLSYTLIINCRYTCVFFSHGPEFGTEKLSVFARAVWGLYRIC